MSSYFVALVNIHDRAKYDRYIAGFGEVFPRYNGEVVAIEENARVLEGEWPARRTVLIRFPTEEDLRTWYDSPEYQELVELRLSASRGAAVIITGRD